MSAKSSKRGSRQAGAHPVDFPDNPKRQKAQDRADRSSRRRLAKSTTVKRVVRKGQYFKEVRDGKGRLISRTKWTQKRRNEQAFEDTVINRKGMFFTRWWASILVIEGDPSGDYQTVISYSDGRTLKGRKSLAEMRGVVKYDGALNAAKRAKQMIKTAQDEGREITVQFNSEYHEVVQTAPKKAIISRQYLPLIAGVAETHGSL